MEFSQLKSTRRHFMNTESSQVVETTDKNAIKEFHHLDEEWIRGMMEKIDSDGDGNINLKEFVEKNMK